jgi:hypothetical protein
VVGPEALAPQQRVQPALAEAAALAGQSTQPLTQPFVIARALGRALDQ